MSLYIFFWTREIKWSETLAQKLQKTDVECVCCDDPQIRELIKKKIKKIPAVVVCENKKGKTDMYIEEHKDHIFSILNIE